MYKPNKICVLGGTGFVGRHLVAALNKRGYSIRVISRHRERHRELLVLPNVEVVSANPQKSSHLIQFFTGCDTVINLIGILNQLDKKDRSFQTAHVDLARKVVDACKKQGVTRLLHMSALRADAAKGSSAYLRSKGQAENLVHTTKGLQVTSFRPSVIFGPDDDFLNRFARLLKMTPSFMPFPLAGHQARFAPIYVGDVVDAMVNTLANPACFDEHYDLCGPKIYTLKQLVEYTAQVSGHKRRIMGLGTGASNLMAGLLSLVPGKPLSRDNLDSMQVDSICKDPIAEELHITPKSLESIAPLYLTNKKLRERFDGFRRDAAR